jgi:hypothetical protein
MDVGLLGSTARPERQSLGLSPCPLGIPLLNSRLPRMRVKAPEGPEISLCPAHSCPALQRQTRLSIMLESFAITWSSRNLRSSVEHENILH